VIERRHLNGDRCPACGGTGRVYQDRDAHHSAGWIPCRFSTSRTVVGNNTTYVDLRCEGGTLSREHSVPQPERTIMNANDRRMSRGR
jgi:hypothetical protein